MEKGRQRTGCRISSPGGLGGMEESSKQAGHINAAVMFMRLALGRLVEGAKAWSPYLTYYS